MGWQVTANDISHWTSTSKREAEEKLPLLFKKLLLANIKTKNISIPSGDSISSGGFDGIVEVLEEHPIIPNGKIIIEFGTNKNIDKKVKDDYDKRTRDNNLNKEDFTFLFVTSCKWTKKNEFENEKNRDKKWKLVKGINADDLEALLLLSPSVHRWFAKLIGKSLSNIFVDIEQACEIWQNQTGKSLSEKLVLTNRNEEIKLLTYLLSAKPSKIIISSQSRQESYAFVILSLRQNIQYISRALVIKTQEEWDSLIEIYNSLILIPNGFTPNDIGHAISKGHFVIESMSNTNTQKIQNTIELPKISKSQKVAIFEEMGFDNDKAWKICDDTKGYLHSIIKHPLLEPFESIKPSWIETYDISTLSSIAFINSWDRENDDDKRQIEILSNKKYDKFEDELYRLKCEENTPIRLVDNIWQVICKTELWNYICHKISKAQIDKLEQIILCVFTEIDPCFSVPPQDRWAAYDKKMKYSNYIRASLADTVALMPIFYKDDKFYEDWISKLFNANINVEAWYSYHEQLMPLSEASPESFLSAVEKAIEHIVDTHLEQLFEDDGDLGDCFHKNLIWALENISWNKEYIARVIIVLAELCNIESKSKYQNSPFNTLVDIFLGWINNSNLTHKEKIKILENILAKKYPSIAQKILLKILPGEHTATTGIYKPTYAEWNEQIENRVNEKDYHNYINEVNRLLFKIITNNKTINWNDIFEKIDKFNLETITKIIDFFTSLDKNSFSDKYQLTLAIQLRAKIYNHRKHTSAKWAIKENIIEKLEKTFYHIEPNRLIYKYKFLFEGHFPNILKPKKYDHNYNYDKEYKKVQLLRKKAVMDILLDEDGLSELIELINIIEYPGIIGTILVDCDFKDYDTAMKWFNSDNRSLVICARSYFCKIFDSNKILFQDIKTNTLDNIQISELLLSMSFSLQTFDLLRQQNDDIQKYYWENVNCYDLKDDGLSQINWILGQFFKYEYPMKAIEFFSRFLHSLQKIDVVIDTKILYNVLLLFFEKQENLKKYDTVKVIEYLQNNHNDFENIELIEWLYIELDGIKPKFLEKKICSNPSYFVQIISFAYKSDNKLQESEKLTQEQIKNKAKRAYELLNKISVIPGQNGNNINTDVLKKWVLEARQLFKECNRVKIGDCIIGQILSLSPIGSDGIWPHESVRDILENFSTEAMIKDFVVGKINQRGVVRKTYDEGGEQEYELSQKYKNDSEELRFSYPETSKALKYLSEHYDYIGKQDDKRNELR